MRKAKMPTAAELRYELHRRSGFAPDQLPALAQAGDAESLEKCAGVAAAVVHNTDFGEELDGLKDWLLNALWQMRAGASPDEAFGVAARAAHRPPDFYLRHKQYRVIQSVLIRVQENPDSKHRPEIFEEVARLYSLSVSTVETYFNNRRSEPDTSVP